MDLIQQYIFEVMKTNQEVGHELIKLNILDKVDLSQTEVEHKTTKNKNKNKRKK